MGIARRYIKKIHEETTFYATWTPSQVLELGDYGPLDGDGAFGRMGNVIDLGFPGVKTIAAPRPADFLDITTEAGTTISIKAAGEIMAGSKLPDASAGLAISLAKANSLVCKLKGPKQETVGNLKELQDFIIDLYKTGKWTKDWRVVSQRVIADGTTIVYSDTDAVDVQVTAKAPITDIADASLGFSLVHKRGGAVNVVGGANLSPFVSLVRLNNPLFGSPSVETFTADMVRTGEVSPVLVQEIPR
jgi:hypothetical protein